MAHVVTKDALYPGTIRKPGRDPLTLTDADIDAAVATANQLVRDGYTIPLYWEHQADDGPVKLSAADKPAHVAKHTFGRVKEAFKDDGGALQLKLEVDAEDDFNRLPKVRFVSPELRRNWTDADGRTHKGWSISHVAATPVPVQREQKPFDPANAIRLSLADYCQLSDGGPAGSGQTGKGSPEGGLDPDKMTPGSGGKGGQVTKCLIALAKKGIKLPEDTTQENIVERLCIVLDALSDVDDSEKPMADLDDVDEADRGTQPYALSLQKHQAKAEKFERQDLTRRIRRLVSTGRITPVMGEKLLGQAGKVQLSFNDDCEIVKNEMHIRVEAYEALPKHASWKPKGERVRCPTRTWPRTRPASRTTAEVRQGRPGRLGQDRRRTSSNPGPRTQDPTRPPRARVTDARSQMLDPWAMEGMGTPLTSTENEYFAGLQADLKLKGVILASTAVDAGMTPTTTLRRGLTGRQDRRQRASTPSTTRPRRTGRSSPSASCTTR
jgi:hypothetical protein